MAEATKYYCLLTLVCLVFKEQFVKSDIYYHITFITSHQPQLFTNLAINQIVIEYVV